MSAGIPGRAAIVGAVRVLPGGDDVVGGVDHRPVPEGSE